MFLKIHPTRRFISDTVEKARKILQDSEDKWPDIPLFYIFGCAWNKMPTKFGTNDLV